MADQNRKRNPIRNPAWADLPHELLASIAVFLFSNPFWVLTFRSVCMSWRSSCPPPPHPNLLSPLFPLYFPMPRGSSFLIHVTVIYLLRRPIQFASGGLISSLTPANWILFVDQFFPGIMSFRKPFPNGHDSVPFGFPRTLNLIDLGAVELGRFYNATHVSLNSGRRFSRKAVDKVVLFPNGLAVVILYHDATVALFRFNEGHFEYIHDGRGFRLDDIIEFKGRVFGVERRGRVYEVRSDPPEIISVGPPVPSGGSYRKRLVESSGLLYLFVRCLVGSVKTKRNRVPADELNERASKTQFKVYQLNEGKTTWVQVSDLRDQTFFFGRDFAFSTSLDLGICEKNCILFEQQSFRPYAKDTVDNLMFTVFSSRNISVGVYPMNDGVRFGGIKLFPEYLDILWPPPSWIWSIDRLRRLEMVETAVDAIFYKIPSNIRTKVERANGAYETAKGPYDDYLPPIITEGVWQVLQLKKLVVILKKVLYPDNRLQEALSLHGHKAFLDYVNHLKLLTQARISSGEAKETLACDDEHQTAMEECGTSRAPLSIIKDLLRERDAMLVRAEEWACKMDAYPYIDSPMGKILATRRSS